MPPLKGYKAACRLGLRAAFVVACAGPAACVNVPGETTLARAELRDVRERILTMSRTSNPTCRDHTVLNTEIVDVYSNGRSA